MGRILDNKVFQILFGIVKCFFILVVIFYIAFIMVQRLTGNRSIFGYRMFTVATGSMAGVYEINDVIAVQDCDVHQLKVGDDIAYRGSRAGLEGMLITHRIIRIEDASDGGRVFVTRGVNAPAEDPSIRENQILGKVVGVVPVITTLNHIVKNQIGFFFLVFCPLVIVIVLEVLQTITDIQLDHNEIKEVEKKENKKKEHKKKAEKQFDFSDEVENSEGKHNQKDFEIDDSIQDEFQKEKEEVIDHKEEIDDSKDKEEIDDSKDKEEIEDNNYQIDHIIQDELQTKEEVISKEESVESRDLDDKEDNDSDLSSEKEVTEKKSDSQDIEELL